MATVIRMILAGFISLTCVGEQVFPSFACAKDDLSMKKQSSYYDGPCSSGDGFEESSRTLCELSAKYQIVVITAEPIAEVKPVPAPKSPSSSSKKIFGSEHRTRRDPNAWKVHQTLFKPTGKSTMPASVHRLKDPIAANQKAKELLEKAPPVFKIIAACESGMKHYSEGTGNVLQGRTTPGDVGLLQINSLVHGEDALKLGFNVWSIYGNIGYAIKLYIEKGTQPWDSSKKCWGPKVPPELRLPLSEQM